MSGGLIYGLEFQCRSLCAVNAESEKVAFLVGTQSLKTRNEIHEIVVVDEEDTTEETLHKQIYSHPKGEIWQLISSNSDPNRFISRHSNIYNNVSNVGATLWDKSPGGSLPSSSSVDASDSLDPNSSGLREICTLGDISGDAVSHVSWMPGERSDKVMVLAGNRLNLCDLGAEVGEDNKAKIVSTGRLEGKGHTSLGLGTWNPHQNSQQYATVNDHTIRGWDIRSMEQVWSFENPGNNAVRSLDFNPNKQYHLATAGDDGCLRFWDIRSPVKPLITRADHSHWIWCVQFNQFHDQLVLTTSSDSHVIMECLASISSEPQGHLVDEDDVQSSSAVLEDGILKTFVDHEESVYVAAWSAADPWTFASLSYDGRLVVNHVPRAVKFKILNLV